MIKKILGVAAVLLALGSTAHAQNLNQPSGQLNNLNTSSSFQGGTWLPQFATTGSPTSLVMTTQAGTYEIVGRQVTVRFNGLSSTSTAGATGQLLLTGLPVASGTSTGDYGVCNADIFGGVTLDSGFGSLAGLITPGNTNVFFQEVGSAKTPQAIQITNVNSTGGSLAFVGSCVYHSP